MVLRIFTAEVLNSTRYQGSRTLPEVDAEFAHLVIGNDIPWRPAQNRITLEGQIPLKSRGLYNTLVL